MNSICSMFFLLSLVSFAAGRAAVNELVISRADGTMCWLQKPSNTSLTDAQRASIIAGGVCVDGFKWDRRTDFFRSGDVVEVIIPKPRFLSTFTATVNATTISEAQPQIRGLAGATAAPAGGAPTTHGAYGNAADALKDLQAQFPAAQHAAMILGGLFTSARQAEQDTSRALSAAGAAYANLSQFKTFLDTTDQLLGQISDLAAQIPTLTTSSDQYLNTVHDVQASIDSRVFASTPDLDVYIKGANYLQIAPLLGGSDQLNSIVQLLFANVNALWRISQDLPQHVLLGQWSGNNHVDFQIAENVHFQSYSFQAPSGNNNQQAQQQTPQQPVQPGASHVNLPGTTPPPPVPQAQAPGGKAQAPGGSPQPVPAIAGQSFFFGGNFDVHAFYVANLVSGFVASTLHARSYGVTSVRAVDNNGNPVSNTNGSPVFADVPVVGSAHRGQLHYYVGVDFYFKERDFFPHAQKAVTPALMFGYGVDDAFNFFLGPNFETKWGLNLGGGYHLGRESFLAPGIVPGVTQLSDPTKAPPTVTHIHGGAYANVGFDLGVFKTIFGSLVGLK